MDVDFTPVSSGNLPMIEGIRSLHPSFDKRSNLTKRRDTYSFIDPYRFKGSLCGKVVLITQAHRGIGRSTAVAFARAGACVCCVGPTAESLEALIREIKEKFNTPTLALTADLLKPDAPAEVVQLIERHLGPVDILINVTPASYLRPFSSEPDIFQDWWPAMESGLRAPVALTHAVLPSMIARGTGTIMSTTAFTGLVSFPFMSAQAVASASLIKFHHQLHLEIVDKGITTFAVNPGPVPSYLHDPSLTYAEQPEHVGMGPDFRKVMGDMVSTTQWCAAGLASGTFLMLCAEPRAKVLSGLFVDAESDLEELLERMEKDSGRRVRDGRLYVLKVDEL